MSSNVETPLNRSRVLRYDTEEGTDADVTDLPVTADLEHPAGSADMAISGLGTIQGTQPVKPIEQTSQSQPAAEAAPPAQIGPVSDSVDISPAGKMLGDINASPEVRAERLAQIKAAIDAGTYDTEERLEAALSKMLDEVGSGFDASS